MSGRQSSIFLLLSFFMALACSSFSSIYLCL
jgi:hypothetical protein